MRHQFFFSIFFGHFFWGGTHFRDFFWNFFFLALHPPMQPPPGGLHTPCSSPAGDYTPHVGRFFFLIFFLKNNFFSSKTGTWVTFLVDWGQRKNIFRLFFGSDLWGTHFGTPLWPPFGTPFGTRFGPILDPFWTLWTHFGPFWTILATLGDYRGHK